MLNDSLEDNVQCDDCEQWYDGPAYYTFEAEACNDDDGPHQECTQALCPQCATYLMPDNINDPRWVIDDFMSAHLALMAHQQEV